MSNVNTSRFHRLLATDASWAPLALRLPIGIIFVAHGAQKLFALGFAMLVAILSVHIGKGLFMANNGYEFGLAPLAASVALLIGGAGRLSVDAALAARARAR